MTTCSNWSGIKNVKLNYVRFFFILLTTRYGSVEHPTAWNKKTHMRKLSHFSSIEDMKYMVLSQIECLK